MIISVIIQSMFKKKVTDNNPGQVIIPVGHPNTPQSHEVDSAYVLARHYRTTVEFIMPVDDYMRKSADIIMLGVEWEIKCPQGKSKSTIGNQFRNASRQAKNIIIDSRRTKLKYDKVEKQVIFEANQRTVLNKVILINKKGKIIEIKK